METVRDPTVCSKGNCIHNAESLCSFLALLNFLRFPQDAMRLEQKVSFLPIWTSMAGPGQQGRLLYLLQVHNLNS